MAARTQVYIKIGAKAGPAWRPVDAEPLGRDLYRIVGSNPSPAVEPWPFSPGDVVRCEPYELTDSDVILVACEKVDPASSG